MSVVDERSVPAASGAGSANYPWLLIGLLWAAAFLNSAGRQILITVLPQVRAEFGLSATQLALINSVGVLDLCGRARSSSAAWATRRIARA